MAVNRFGPAACDTKLTFTFDFFRKSPYPTRGYATTVYSRIPALRQVSARHKQNTPIDCRDFASRELGLRSNGANPSAWMTRSFGRWANRLNRR